MLGSYKADKLQARKPKGLETGKLGTRNYQISWKAGMLGS